MTVLVLALNHFSAIPWIRKQGRPHAPLSTYLYTKEKVIVFDRDNFVVCASRTKSYELFRRQMQYKAWPMNVFHSSLSDAQRSR